MQGFLCQIEVGEEADQRGKDAARIGAVDGVDPLTDVFERGIGHANNCNLWLRSTTRIEGERGSISTKAI